MLILSEDGGVRAVEDRFTVLGDEEGAGRARPVILSRARFEADAERLWSEGFELGVRLAADDKVEDLAYDLPRLAVVALEFPKFRDGRAFTSAVLLRQRYGFLGEVRAVGDVLLDQAFAMVRCGFSAFETRASAADWARAIGRYAVVYQTSADGRQPAFLARATKS